MQCWKIAVAATAMLFVLSNASLIGQGKGNGGSKAPKAQAPSTKPTQSPKAPAPTAAKGPKAPKAGAPTTTKSGHGKTTATAKATAPKGKSDVASGKTTKAKASTATAKNTKSASTTTTSTTDSGVTGTNTGTSSTTTGDTVSLSPAQQKLQKNTNLASKLQSRLPAGTDLMTAAEGFRNLGQFVAAVNVSNNLGIPFADLKMKMVDEHLSLGQSIQALKPTASGTIEAQRAEYDAQGMIYESEQAQTSTTTSTTTSKKKTKPSGTGGGSDE
jgi:hypothetical protein